MKAFFHKPYWASNALVLSLLSVLLSLLCTGEALVKLPKNVTVPAVILFGDSIVDQGANNNLRTLIKCNFAPYGQDFKGGVPTGRFSNGKTPPDLIAEELGIKELVPAYLDSNTKDEDLRTGVSFASGGSGYDPQTPKLVSVLSLADQLKMFNEYIGKLKGLVGEEETSNILANSLFLLVSGNNDLANTYYTIGLRRLQYDLPSYADLMVASASNFIQEIYKLGARRIGVFSAPPIGCLPAQRTLAGGALRVCVEDHNQGAQMYNMKLSSEIDSLDNSLSQAKVVYIDIYNSLLDIIKNPQSYGLDVVDRGCCGSGIVEVAILCNHATPTCLDNSKYLFWDSFHPTEKGYRLLVGQIIPKYLEDSCREFSSTTIMQFFSSLSIYAILVFLLLCTNGTRAAIKLPRSKTIPAVIMFGDSIVDTGNNSYIETIFKVNYPPYGKDFMGGKPTGSFCDGKVPSDLLVEELGIKQLLPPYLDPTLQAKDLRAGLNFASGGAGFDPLTYELAKVISLSDQLDLYKEFLARLKELVGEDITSTIVSNSLYIVVVGSNDITNTYYNNPLQSLHFDFSSYTDLMLDSASVFAQALHNLGGRRIGLFGVSPIGCLPSQRTLAGGALRNCAENYNQLSQPFNKKLSAQLNFLNANLPQARMVYVGAFSLPLELINSPTKYGEIITLSISKL
ncbi:hypothetical protein RJ639_016746 [Escallonia herrerae]|uniref:GDSL esterase/lipase EXL3 n=1 Tax=Escallonia herrerae TaxID=1293975 RepID=A0AA88VEL6_9ASTE|nr:hypothetical protein RJ639_016746 [Escallonia herrerae]